MKLSLTLASTKSLSLILRSLSVCLVLGCIFFSSSQLIGQETVPRHFRTIEYQENLLAEFPELGASLGRIERRVQQAGFIPDSLGQVTLPIVFHVLTSLGEEPISREVIQSQIDALNRDFAKTDGGEISEGWDQDNFYQEQNSLDLKFCYANVLDGGINYLLSPLSILGITNNIKNTAQGGASAINPEQFINIWIVDLPESVSGYAQMPGGPLVTDGIVIDKDFFGQYENEENPYGEGKTLTHLIGNYLGLNDLWNKHYCGDDGIRDTPIHNAPNFGCNDVGKHVSLCPGNPVEMTMNFMDNSYDSCTYLFTQGQKDRILAMLSSEGPRAGLLHGAILCEDKKNEVTPPPETVAQNLNESVKPSVLLVPNPADDLFTVQIDNKPDLPAQMVIYSVAGKIMENRQLNPGASIRQDISCANWPTGIYIVSIRLKDDLYTNRIMVN